MFNKIDLSTWPRSGIFHYFSEMAPTGYSLTVRLDVTKAVEFSKAHQIKFFPIYLWMVTRNLNKMQEFKCAYLDGCPGYYDTLTPMYATWHEETKTFSLMWTPYCNDFMEFYNKYLENQRLYGNNPGVLSQPGLPPANAYTVSAIPWVNFEHFAVHSYSDSKYFFPSLEAGKYEKSELGYLMPLSITCHHATTDGYHVSEFIRRLQEDINNIDNLIMQPLYPGYFS